MRNLLTKNHLTIKKIFNKFLTQPRKALEKMTGYQKVKIANETLNYSLLEMINAYIEAEWPEKDIDWKVEKSEELWAKYQYRIKKAWKEYEAKQKKD